MGDGRTENFILDLMEWENFDLVLYAGLGRFNGKLNFNYIAVMKTWKI